MATIKSGYQEASDVLAEALKQMDGLLAGTLKRGDHPSSSHNYSQHNGLVDNPALPHNGVGSPKLTNSPKLENSRAIRLLNDLRLTLEGTPDQGQIFRQLAPDTQIFLQDWLGRCSPHSLSNGYTHPATDNSEGKLRKLETDKDDLLLQVSVLSDQIEAQVEKIRDLERALKTASNGNGVLSTTNGNTSDVMNGSLYDTELLNRNHGNSNGQDTHKLDLLAENSNLKLRLASMDREKGDLEQRLNYTQKRMDELQSRLNDQTIEVSDLRLRAAKNGTIPSSPEPSDMSRDRTLEREKTLDRLKRKHSEVERLKKAVESLMITNSEKDVHIDDLKNQVKRYHQLEHVLLGSQGRQGAEQLHLEDKHSDTSSTPNSHTSGGGARENGDRYDITDHLHTRPTDLHGRADLRDHLMQPTATSTPLNNIFGSPKSQTTNNNQTLTLPSGLTPSHTHTPSPKRQTSHGLGRSSSFEDVKPHPRISPAVRAERQGHSGTLPKDARLVPHPSQPPAQSPVPQDLPVSSQSRPRASTLPKGKPPRGPGQGTLTPKGSFRRGAPHEGSARDASAEPGQDSSNSPTLSRQNSTHNKPSSAHNPRRQQGFMSFGKGIFKARSGKWSSSAPNLGAQQCMLRQSQQEATAEPRADDGAGREPQEDCHSDNGAQSEAEEEALKDEMAQEYKQLQKQGAERQHRKHKGKGGIKRFFGKLRRSNSQDLDPDKVGDFKRSGLRATAGPRLGWSKDMKYSDVDVPFGRWDSDRVASWLHAQGLSMYVADCKRWVKNGDQLVKASSQDLEKELGIRNYFHRKKLLLAVQAVSVEKTSSMDDLDHNWVTRWMDDIGLPQYKDNFSDARIDGRMLHYLSVDDLVNLKVTNVLHHLSVKRAIQVLRLSDFNAGCLKRRPVPEEGKLKNVPGDVMLWTNHRVMEWLRSIDLSEYAPNLRGSGVHGGLMVLEPRFGAEIFASLLSIPNNKTLLRRHLSTHYVTLIGNDIQGKKREIELQTGFIPLTPNQKVKLKKRLFGHKRTRSIDTADEDLVCPLGAARQSQISNNSQTNGSPSWNREDTLPRDDKQNMLARDRFLDDVPTSDV